MEDGEYEDELTASGGEKAGVFFAYRKAGGLADVINMIKYDKHEKNDKVANHIFLFYSDVRQCLASAFRQCGTGMNE